MSVYFHLLNVKGLQSKLWVFYFSFWPPAYLQSFHPDGRRPNFCGLHINYFCNDLIFKFIAIAVMRQMRKNIIQVLTLLTALLHLLKNMTFHSEGQITSNLETFLISRVLIRERKHLGFCTINFISSTVFSKVLWKQKKLFDFQSTGFERAVCCRMEDCSQSVEEHW